MQDRPELHSESGQPGLHETHFKKEKHIEVEPGVMAYAYNPSTCKRKQEDCCEFKATLS